MSINNKTKAAVDTLLTNDATTEAQFKTGLQDVTTEVDNLNTGTVKTTTNFSGDVSGTYNAIVVANDSHTHDTRYYTETEIDNMFSGTTDKTGYNNDNWDTAYGWGDHGAEGYLTDVNVSDIVADDILISTETFVDSDTKVMSAAAIDDRITARLPSDAPPSSTERSDWNSAYDAVIGGTVDVNIEQGAIDGTPIGATTPSTGAFTTLSTSGLATLDSLSVSNDVGITGNLTVNGTTTTLDSTNTVVQDNLLELNSGVTTNVNDSGIIIERGDTGANAIMLWDESEDSFAFGTTTATADSTGNIAYNTANLTVGDVTASTLYGTGLALTGNLEIQTEYPVFEIIGTSTGTLGPSIQFHHNSASPADNDNIAIIYFYGEDSFSNKTEYGRFTVNATDVTNGLEETNYNFKGLFSGSSRTFLTLDPLDSTLYNNSFTIESSNSGTLYPVLKFDKQTTSPSDSDYLAQLQFCGLNSGLLDHTYAKLLVQSIDVTDNTENSRFNFQVCNGNTLYGRVTIDYDETNVYNDLIVGGNFGLNGNAGVVVTDIKDEDTMSSNSATALATQQSIKAYVDNEIANVGGVNSGYVNTSAISLGGFQYPSSATSPINYTFNTPGNYIVVTLNFTANLNADGDEENSGSVTVALEYSLNGGTSYSTFTSVSKTSNNTSFSNVTSSDATVSIPTPNSTTTIHFRIRKTSGSNSARASSSSISNVVMRDYDLASWPTAN